MLLSIQGGSNLGIFEINDAARLVQEAVHPEANIIFGAVIDDTLGDEVRVTVIAAGFDGGEPAQQQKERRSSYVDPESSVSAPVAASTGAIEDSTTSSPSWASQEHQPPVQRAADPAFDDDDELDVPDFLK